MRTQIARSVAFPGKMKKNHCVLQCQEVTVVLVEARLVWVGNMDWPAVYYPALFLGV